jgi:rod shape-determining protein MreC
MKRSQKQSIRIVVGIGGILLLGVLVWPTGRAWLVSRIHTSVPSTAASSDAEVQALKKENAKLKAEVSSLMSLKEENERLRKALGIQDQADIKDYISARVSMRGDGAYLRRSVMLNVGQEAGVAKGQAVIHNGFVIGQIAEVNAETSRVQLITDPDSKVAVRIANDQDSKGVLKSPLGVELNIELVPQTEEVTSGTKVFTSGVDSLPARLPVGSVKHVNSSQTQYHDITLQTPVDFQKLREVFILVPS